MVAITVKSTSIPTEVVSKQRGCIHNYAPYALDFTYGVDYDKRFYAGMALDVISSFYGSPVGDLALVNPSNAYLGIVSSVLEVDSDTVTPGVGIGMDVLILTNRGSYPTCGSTICITMDDFKDKIANMVQVTQLY